jgi:hypothetical protein
MALGESRQGIDRAGAFQHYRLRRPVTERLRSDALAGQALNIRGRTAVARMHPQHHGRCVLIGAQDVLPLRGMVAPQRVDPPARMVPHRLGLRARALEQCVPLAQEAAQAGVDEARLRPQRRVAPRRLDRLVHQGEVRVACRLVVAQQGQREQQQGIDRRGRRAARELRPHALRHAEPTHRIE